MLEYKLRVASAEYEEWAESDRKPILVYPGTFDDYKFKLNGKEYEQLSAAFEAALAKHNTWELLQFE